MKFPKLLARLGLFNRHLRSSKSAQFELYCAILRSLCESHEGHPITTMISGLLEDQDWVNLYAYADQLSKQTYTTAHEHFVGQQWAALIKKFPFPKNILDLKPRDNAIAAFWAAEHRCKRVNQKFRLYRTLRSPNEALLDRMRSFIAYVLGPLDLDKVYDNCDFGPGAAIGVHGNATNISRKLLAEKWSVTPGAYSYAFVACMRTRLRDSLWSHSQVPSVVCYDVDDAEVNFAKRCCVTIHNKISFVPKTAKISRSVAVEPLLNGFVQTGIDKVMREKLKRIGIDLSSQRRNQLYAQYGSEDWQKENGFVTIDLSAASDSIARELVRDLLPADWYALLNATRSKTGQLSHMRFVYEKFCSMGNGFCFPLETLIFAAACHAAGCGKPRLDYMVYGDDIVVRRSAAASVISLLRELGFKTNKDKTFVDGPFRESCGEDFFGGVAVRPYTLKNAFDSLESIIKFLNGIQRNEKTKWFFQDMDYALFKVPPDLRFVRPYPGPDDSAVTVEIDAFMASPFAKFDVTTWSWIHLGLQSTPLADSAAMRHEESRLALVYAALRGANSKAPFTLRRVTRTKISRQRESANADQV